MLLGMFWVGIRVGGGFGYRVYLSGFGVLIMEEG